MKSKINIKRKLSRKGRARVFNPNSAPIMARDVPYGDHKHNYSLELLNKVTSPQKAIEFTLPKLKTKLTSSLKKYTGPTTIHKYKKGVRFA